MQKKVIFLVGTVAILFFSYGVLVGHYNFFPFDILSNTKNTISPQSESGPRIQIHQDFSQVDKLVSIKNPDDITIKKQNLTEFIWPDTGLPVNLPVEHNVNVSDELSNLENLERIDSFTVEMDYGMNSIS